MKKVLVLGATGSIGRATIDVIRNGDYEAAGLVSNRSDLTVLMNEFGCPGVRVSSDGVDAIKDLIEATKPDIAVNGIAGAAGLLPSKMVLDAGVPLALANKETIVMAWDFLKGVVIPVDSEHSAIRSLIDKVGKTNINKIILTASGGPFRTTVNLEGVTAAEALKHPTWRMGKKITIDSATLANKGLEVIEAARLFDMPLDKIEVVIHPQSLVHSLVQTVDGVMYAQISDPDMKRPIIAALDYPEVKSNYLEPFSLYDKTFTFFRPRMNDFPMLSYAYEVAKKGRGYPVAYNAANEVAVGAFLAGAIDFVTISRIVRAVLDKDWPAIKSFEEVFEADKKARTLAEKELR